MPAVASYALAAWRPCRMRGGSRCGVSLSDNSRRHPFRRGGDGQEQAGRVVAGVGVGAAGGECFAPEAEVFPALPLKNAIQSSLSGKVATIHAHAAARSRSIVRSRLFRVSAAARSNSPRASSQRPSFASRSPRTLGKR
jgi:hypothetical protein